MSKYLGVKLIEAVPALKKGGKVYHLDWPIPKSMDTVEMGYEVTYPDGYVSFSPKDVFESAYMPLERDNNTISQSDVDGFISNIHSQQIGDKTTFVMVTLKNGFTITESSSCVDPANFNMEIGASICMEKIKDKIWFLLGFLLQSGVKGFK